MSTENADTPTAPTEDAPTDLAHRELARDPNGSPAAPGPVDADTAEVPDEPEPQSKREARYRTQLRETEAERDQLAAKVEALQRAEVERLAAKVIQQPSALWAAQTSLSDLLTDDGTVDEKKVAAAANAAKQSLGLAATRSGTNGPVVPLEGTGRHRSSTRSAWEAAFK